MQVGSLSSFKVSRQLLTNDLNQVSSVSLLMTASTALANEGLFELTEHPLLRRAISSSFTETAEDSPGASVLSVIDNETACINERCRVSSKSPYVGEGRRGSHEEGNGRDLIQVLP